MNVQGLAQSLGCRLVEAIEKGWSGDRKFLLEDGAGERFVLRLSAKQEEQKKRREFERVRQLDAMGLPVSRAVAFGCREDAVYQLLNVVLPAARLGGGVRPAPDVAGPARGRAVPPGGAGKPGAQKNPHPAAAPR